jgi:hypothetical protein
MVVAAFRMIGPGADTSFSGACCRMGCLTVATRAEAGVPESIL